MVKRRERHAKLQVATRRREDFDIRVANRPVYFYNTLVSTCIFYRHGD